MSGPVPKRRYAPDRRRSPSRSKSGADPYGEDRVGQRASIIASSAGPRLDVATALALHSLDGTATPEAHGNVNRLEVVQPEPAQQAAELGIQRHSRMPLQGFNDDSIG